MRWLSGLDPFGGFRQFPEFFLDGRERCSGTELGGRLPRQPELQAVAKPRKRDTTLFYGSQRSRIAASSLALILNLIRDVRFSGSRG